MQSRLRFQRFSVDSAFASPDVAEKSIRKLRTAMMPPPTARKPAGDTLLALVETLEQTVDRAWKPNPGSRPFQRLNRPEYEAAVRDLLGVTVNAGDYLPLDTKSANFDNIADVQALSPTLLEAYLTAASAVSRMAVGDKTAPAIDKTYVNPTYVSQHPWDHVEGAPFGTRGGMVVDHVFPADGQYSFEVALSNGDNSRFEDIDISIDGQRVALLAYENGPQIAADGSGAHVNITNHPGNDRSGTDSHADLQVHVPDFRVGFEQRSHFERHVRNGFCVVGFIFATQAAGDHVRVTDRLDLFDAVFFCQLIESGKDGIQHRENATGRHARCNAREIDDIGKHHGHIGEPVSDCLVILLEPFGGLLVHCIVAGAPECTRDRMDNGLSVGEHDL